MHSARLSMVGIKAVMQSIPQAAAAFLVSSPIQTALKPLSISADGFSVTINPLTVEPLVNVT